MKDSGPFFLAKCQNTRRDPTRALLKPRAAVG
jgi:hypothetical protein